VFLAHGGIEVDVVAAGGELESERPDDLFVVDVVGIAEDAPEVGELEAGKLAGDEMVGFSVAEERGGRRVVFQDVVEALEIGGEAMIGLDEDAVFAGADDGIGLRGVFDDGDIAGFVSNEVVFRDGGGEFRESVEGLASGFTLFGDITDEVIGLETVIPLVDMGVSEADIEAVLVQGVFKIRFAGVFAGVVAPDAFIRESEIAVRAFDSEGVAFEKLARIRKPVVIAADETFVVFADGENRAAVLTGIGFAALLIDGASDFFVEQKIRLEMKRFGRGEDFVDNFGIILFVDSLLDAESVHVGGSKEIVTVRAKTLGEKATIIGVRTTKLKHKFIIA